VVGLGEVIGFGRAKIKACLVRARQALAYPREKAANSRFRRVASEPGYWWVERVAFTLAHFCTTPVLAV
jgi:hypothetical protein